MQFLKSSIGRKLVMAATGLAMLFFIVVHVIGNSTVYFGWLNAYAEHLHALPPLVWLFRLTLLAMFLLHSFFGIQLTLENRASKPGSYAVRKSVRATFAGRTMIWTGLLIAAFLAYHLLHFTFQVTNPEISSGRNVDVVGRPDVSRMVLMSFRNVFISCIYVISMIALALHLSHGIQSFFQTTGLDNERVMPAIIKAGMITAVILLLGYISIPAAVMLRILKG